MQQLLSNKKFLSLYATWVFVHTIFYFSSDKYYNDAFWPFTEHSLNNCYDGTEWIAYVFGPVLLIFLYISFKNEDDQRENNIEA